MAHRIHVHALKSRISSITNTSATTIETNIYLSALVVNIERRNESKLASETLPCLLSHILLHWQLWYQIPRYSMHHEWDSMATTHHKWDSHNLYSPIVEMTSMKINFNWIDPSQKPLVNSSQTFLLQARLLVIWWRIVRHKCLALYDSWTLRNRISPSRTGIHDLDEDDNEESERQRIRPIDLEEDDNPVTKIKYRASCKRPSDNNKSGPCTKLPVGRLKHCDEATVPPWWRVIGRCLDSLASCLSENAVVNDRREFGS